MFKKKKKKASRLGFRTVSDNFVRLWDLLARTTRFRFIVRQQCIFKTRNEVSFRLGDLGLVCFGSPPPLLNELRAIPSGSHHLPLFSLSLALISTMCNESYLKPTKTSSTSLSQFQGELRGRYRQEEESLKRWGAWEGEGSSSPLSDPPLRLPRS